MKLTLRTVLLPLFKCLLWWHILRRPNCQPLEMVFKFSILLFAILFLKQLFDLVLVFEAHIIVLHTIMQVLTALGAFGLAVLDFGSNFLLRGSQIQIWIYTVLIFFLLFCIIRWPCVKVIVASGALLVQMQSGAMVQYTVQILGGLLGKVFHSIAKEDHFLVAKLLKL